MMGENKGYAEQSGRVGAWISIVLIILIIGGLVAALLFNFRAGEKAGADSVWLKDECFELHYRVQDDIWYNKTLTHEELSRKAVQMARAGRNGSFYILNVTCGSGLLYSEGNTPTKKFV